MPAPGFDLMIVSDGRPDLVPRLARALTGTARGRVAVQLRERSLRAAELLELARALRALTRERGALLLVNDRVDVALAVAADGVHLPEAGLPAQVVRTLLGPDALLGGSRHGGADGLSSPVGGLDYVTLSPVHEVPGKAPALGLTGFARLAALTAVPVYALGGVRAQDVAGLLERGARGVAVMREVLAADDPALRAHQLLARLAGEAP